VNTCSTSANVTAPNYLGPYNWSGPGGFTSTSQSITPTVSGTYTLTSGSPSLTTTQIITLNFSVPPSVNVTSTSSLICLGQTATLTATGLTTYTWNTGATGSSIVVTPTASAIYSVNGFDSNSCAGSGSTFVGVSLCTGVGEANFLNPGINLYPNPNNGEFVLKIGTQMNNMELLIENNLGQIVHTQTVSQGENKIRTKNLAQGIYHYLVLENKQVIGQGKMKIE